MNSGGIQDGGVQRGRHSISRCEISRRSRDAAWRTTPGVKAASSFESGKGEVKALNGPIWSRCSIAPTYPSK